MMDLKFAFTSIFERKNPKKGLYGSCILVLREDYEKINGHESIKAEVLDDLFSRNEIYSREHASDQFYRVWLGFVPYVPPRYPYCPHSILGGGAAKKNLKVVGDGNPVP